MWTLKVKIVLISLVWGRAIARTRYTEVIEGCAEAAFPPPSTGLSFGGSTEAEVDRLKNLRLRLVWEQGTPCKLTATEALWVADKTVRRALLVAEKSENLRVGYHGHSWAVCACDRVLRLLTVGRSLRSAEFLRGMFGSDTKCDNWAIKQLVKAVHWMTSRQYELHAWYRLILWPERWTY